MLTKYTDSVNISTWRRKIDCTWAGSDCKNWSTTLHRSSWSKQLTETSWISTRDIKSWRRTCVLSPQQYFFFFFVLTDARLTYYHYCGVMWSSTWALLWIGVWMWDESCIRSKCPVLKSKNLQLSVGVHFSLATKAKESSLGLIWKY